MVGGVDQPGYEVARHGNQEGVGDDGYPGQADHDVVPDADIVDDPGARLPVTDQHLLSVQPEHTETQVDIISKNFGQNQFFPPPPLFFYFETFPTS